MTDSPQVAPGWYPAPSEPGLQRYWSGTDWADDRRPIAPETPAAKSPGGAIAAFVISIVAIVTSVAGGGVVLGLVALIVLAVTKANRTRNPLGTAALVIALAAMIITFLVVGLGTLQG